MALGQPEDLPGVGDAFAARQMASIAGLYGHQAEAVIRIIRSVHAIAVKTFLARDGTKRSTSAQDIAKALHGPDGDDPSDFARPHNAYVIDGRRGSGKTTALLTLRRHLSALRFGSVDRASHGEDYQIAQSLASLKLSTPPGVRGDHRVALVLPIVFTEDMEAQESTMEAVFALLEQELDLQARRADGKEAKARIEQLKASLRSEISVSWTYSRKIGVEALSNDALDYADFVEKRADLNAKAYTKVITWRRYLDDFLDALGYQVLVLLFDDSDLNPGVAEDIIRSIRMYFTHPRTLSILAVEMRTLTDNLIARNLSQMAVMPSPTYAETPSKLEILKDRMVDLEDRNTVALLDKILPQPNRFLLSVGDMKHVDFFFRDSGESDARTKDAFQRYCRTHFDLTRSRGLPDFSWWLIAGPYKRLFAADIRGMIAFRVRTEDGEVSPLQALFDHGDVSSLAEEAEHDLSILQELVAAGEMEMSLSNLGSQPRLFLNFWMDSKIAGGQLRESATIPGIRWLSDQISMASERTHEDGGARGLSGVLSTELLPRNCLFFYQLRRLRFALRERLPAPSAFARALAAVAYRSDAGLLTAAMSSMRSLVSEAGGLDDGGILNLIRARLASLVQPEEEEGEEVDVELADSELAAPEEAALVAVMLASVARNSPDGGRQMRRWLATAEEDQVEFDWLKTFFGRLAQAVPDAERRRQESLFLWSCANDLAALGDDDVRLRPREARREIVDAAKFTYHRPRLVGLARDSVERVAGRPRHGLLLAWSIVPLIESLHDFGADYLSTRGESREDWKEVLSIFEKALAAFRSEVPEGGEGGWLFADMDEALLSRIVSDVEAGSSKVRQLSKKSAAGSLSLDGFWKQPPSTRLGALLGTSEAWVSENLGV